LSASFISSRSTVQIRPEAFSNQNLIKASIITKPRGLRLIKKIRLIILCIMILLLSSTFINAQEIVIKNLDIIFDIQEDDSIIQTMNFTFNTALSKEDLEYEVSKSVNNIKILIDNKNIKYDLVNQESYHTIRMLPKNPTRDITIKYKADDVIFYNENIKHFFTDLSLDLPIESLKVKTILPRGYGIYQGSFKPEDSIPSSDGERIILAWQDSNINQPLFFSVKYSSLDKGNTFLITILIFLILFIIFITFHFKKKVKKEFISGFRTDDQKVIHHVQDKKIILQRDIEKLFKFSRAKSTRIIARLEEKSLIKKEKFGRTNKIYWIK
jgi:hypothetical protein